ncbi:MAG: sigma-70 family RNA polymerase sigma factor [Roseiarcus sp.]|uniref:sigma-70 family RNA polymerase sigma factor n=1 Tax=Roseiarcus sp. TaxID=1969460 RepID=UPI003BAE68C1
MDHALSVRDRAATRRKADAAMIQRPSSVVLGLMTVAIRIPASFDLPRFRRVARRRVRVAQAAASGTAMSNSSGSTRRRDEWGGRIGAIAASHDRIAFAELFAFFAPRVKGYLQRTGTSEAQAEDLAQETMLAVWRKAALYDPGTASAATWIFTIARNLRIDSLRRARRGGAIQVEAVEAEYEVDDAPLADARVATAEAETRVRKALKTLPLDQLRVIELSFFEERPHGEIARTLQIPLGTVKSRVRLAMRRLRGLLDELQ